MNEADFETAQKMAQVWARQRTDPNEVAKSLRYLTEHPNGRQFFRYLRTVMQEGRAVVRSERSLDYYSQIDQVCRKHLTPYVKQPKRMAEVLGWAVRLTRYYRVEPDLRQSPPPKRKRPQATVGAPSGNRRSGRVKWFNDQKRFGFIQPDGGGKDVFVHLDGLAVGVSTLRDGQRVEFEVVIESKGPKAIHVQPIG